MVIMIVDDERLAREGIEGQMHQMYPDAEIDCFADSNEAVKSSRKKHYDIAFLDIMMEPFDGIETARLLMESAPRINIIFTTGFDNFTKEAMELHASGYITKPVTKRKLEKEMDFLRYALDDDGVEPPLKAHCFGNFDFFINGSIPTYAYSKTKELLAYLIDRQGMICSNGEIASILGDDESDDVLGYSYLNAIRRDLAKILEDAGFPDVFIRTRGGMRIDSTRIACDYYDLLEGKPGAEKAYGGEYMSQYSWAEITNGEIWKKWGA